MKPWAIGILFALLALSPQAEAYRPFDSTDADVAETGALEIEAAPVGYIQTGALRQLQLPNLVLNYGFLPRWEVVLEGINLLTLNPPEGTSRESIAETDLFCKHVLRPGVLQSGTGVSLATEFGLLLPTYHDDDGIGLWASLIMSYRWSNFAFHLNAAAEVVRSSTTRTFDPGGVEGIILEGPDRWRVRPVAEILTEEVWGGAYTVSGLIGAIGRINDDLSLDLAVRWGTSDLGEIREIRAGFSWSIPLVHADK